MIRLINKPIYRMSLDFTNLSPPIVSPGEKNYKIECTNPIDGYMTKNSKSKDKLHSVIMLHEWWGFNKSITTTADLFSNENIKVFVPDLYRGQPAVNAEVIYCQYLFRKLDIK